MIRRRRGKGEGGPFTRFTAPARESVVLAQHEARELGHGYIGTEHLLMGVAREERGTGGRALRSLGATPGELRDDLKRIVGQGGELDRDALASIGIDLDEVRRRVEETFGPGALDRPAGCFDSPYIPFTPRSKKALELSVRAAVARGDEFVGSEHLLLGLVKVDDGVAARILSDRGLTGDRLEAAVRDARRAA
jgi:ATP-dependent Clp protease ATP-binding subunit ClpA